MSHERIIQSCHVCGRCVCALLTDGNISGVHFTGEFVDLTDVQWTSAVLSGNLKIIERLTRFGLLPSPIYLGNL